MLKNNTASTVKVVLYLWVDLRKSEGTVSGDSRSRNFGIFKRLQGVLRTGWAKRAGHSSLHGRARRKGSIPLLAPEVKWWSNALSGGTWVW